MSKTIQTDELSDFFNEIKERKVNDEYSFEKIFYRITDEELKGQSKEGKALLRIVSTFLFTALSNDENKYVIYQEQLRSQPISSQEEFDNYDSEKQKKEISFIEQFKNMGQFQLTKGIIQPRVKQ
jgi:predicted neutral ceramidase superfamily lipid hydrolase